MIEARACEYLCDIYVSCMTRTSLPTNHVLSLAVSPLIALDACDTSDQFTMYLRWNPFSAKNIKFVP